MFDFNLLFKTLAIVGGIGSLLLLFRSQARWRVPVALLLFAGALLCLAMSIRPISAPEKTAADEAAAKITANFSDPVLQEFGGNGFSFGPKDEPTRKVTDRDRAHARDFVQALCEGNIDKMQQVVDRFDGKPFTLAKVFDVVNYSLYKAGAGYQVLGYGTTVHLRCQERHNGFDGVIFRVGAKPGTMKTTLHPDGNGSSSQQTDELPAAQWVKDASNLLRHNVISGQFVPKDDN